ncbi:MAG: peptidase M22 [Clostridia bacterium]|nr:peptidase M22 [Clostridia bacterium]
MIFFGIDSSNYRSSAAALFGDNSFINKRKLLFVENGKRGLRQSDAVFLHTKQLPLMVTEVMKEIEPLKIKCIGVSSKPRNALDSYMPCFLSGVSLASVLGAALKIPVFEFSHQEGHIAAALLSADRLDLFDKPFIAFHLSGGTTEAILVSPSNDGGFKTAIVGKTLDINAGQVIDRVGVMLGLDFPSGPALEQLAEKGSAKVGIRPCIKGCDCALSGAENICQKMLDDGDKYEDIAATAIEYVISTVCKMALAVSEKYNNLPFVFSGGVVANTNLKKRLSEIISANFASPELSGDNAVGTALLAKIKMEKR